MSVKHSIWRAVSVMHESLPFRSNIRAGLRILCYHSVGAVLPGDPYGLSIEASVFRSQMESIASGRFGKPVSLGSAKLDGSPEIAVTFDDGYADTLTAAAPILAGFKIPFTVAVTAAFVKGGKVPHLTIAQLRELAKIPGAEIGAHGANHREMARCGDDELASELADSRKFVEDSLGSPATVMTWPHGSTSRRTADFARRAGFVRAGCSLYGVNEPGREPLLLKRTEIVAFDSAADFERKCSGGWDWFALRQGDPAGA